MNQVKNKTLATKPRFRNSIFFLSLSCCSFASHGSVLEKTYVAGEYPTEVLGVVEGQSCQIIICGWPIGEVASTAKALDDAMSKKPGTLGLVNVSIDDRYNIHLFYNEYCIDVNGVAVSIK